MKYLLFSILFFLVIQGKSQEGTYNVIRVNGEIINVSLNEKLIQGKKVKPKDKLDFDKDAFAYVISESRKKFMLQTPNVQTEDEDIFAYAEMALSPIRSRGQLSTRGAVSETGVKDFKTYLGNENFNVIGEQLKIPMDVGRYPLNSNDYIVFYYKIQGKVVSKKVGFRNQVLSIDRKKLMESKGMFSSSDSLPELSVYKYNPNTGDSEFLTTINLNFISEKVLKNEMNTLLPILQGQQMTRDEIRDYLFNYVFDIYGNIDEDQLNAFLNEALIE